MTAKVTYFVVVLAEVHSYFVVCVEFYLVEVSAFSSLLVCSCMLVPPDPYMSWYAGVYFLEIFCEYMVMQRESTIPTIKLLGLIHSACPYTNYVPKCSQMLHQVDYLTTWCVIRKDMQHVYPCYSRSLLDTTVVNYELRVFLCSYSILAWRVCILHSAEDTFYEHGLITYSLYSREEKQMCLSTACSTLLCVHLEIPGRGKSTTGVGNLCAPHPQINIYARALPNYRRWYSLLRAHSTPLYSIYQRRPLPRIGEYFPWFGKGCRITKAMVNIILIIKQLVRPRLSLIGHH